MVSPAGTCLGALGAPVATVIDGFQGSEEAGSPEVIAVHPEPLASDGPEMAMGQGDRAIALALGDPRMKQRLAGKQYTVEGAGPWSTGGENDTLVGAIVSIHLSQPANYPMSDWPIADYATPNATSYTDANMRLSAENVTDFVVSVDLMRNRVVGSEPDGEDIRVTPDASPPPPPPW